MKEKGKLTQYSLPTMPPATAVLTSEGAELLVQRSWTQKSLLFFPSLLFSAFWMAQSNALLRR